MLVARVLSVFQKSSVRWILGLALSFFMGVFSVFAGQNFLVSQYYLDVEASGSDAASANNSDANEVAEPFWEAARTPSNPFNMNFFEITDIEKEAAPIRTGDTTDKILADSDNRIGPEFEIPEPIYNQTKFWFRIYTEFDSTKKVIHHSLHPHIIYDVVDVSEILSAPTRAQWLNNQKAQRVVSKRVHEIRLQLLKMSRKKVENFSEEEAKWWKLLSELKGQRQKILAGAAGNLRMQTGQKNFFENGLVLSTRYLPGMEAIFDANGLPREFTRLPFVESSFVIGATSKVGAAGIWQFMPTIGRKFMKVTDQIDERRNPWKASQAAAKLLKENHQILHRKWGLALTAYNHGPGGVRLAIQKTKSTDIAKIVKTYRSKNFDFASANFFTCFLAALHAQMYRDILWPNLQSEPPLEIGSLVLTRSYSPKRLAQVSNLEPAEILLYNPELDRAFKYGFMIPRGYRIFLSREAEAQLTKTLAFAEPKEALFGLNYLASDSN